MLVVAGWFTLWPSVSSAFKRTFNTEDTEGHGVEPFQTWEPAIWSKLRG